MYCRLPGPAGYQLATTERGRNALGISFSPPPGGFAWTLQNLTAADKTQGVTSFRLSDAFDKWERASELMQQLHQDARQITAQLCAYLPRDSPEAVHKASEIRRLIMLGCTLMKTHVRGEKSDLEFEVSHGLLLTTEQEALKKVTTVASGPAGDGKKDKYPSKNRPAFAFQDFRRH